MEINVLKILVALTFLLLSQTEAFCAIAYDADSDNNGYGAVSSVTLNHTVGSLTNGILVVGVARRTNTQANGVVSGVTYNGQALTQARTQEATNQAVNTWGRADVWYLVNPASGAHDCVVTFAGTILQGALNVASFQGVNQTSPTNVVNSTQRTENQGSTADKTNLTTTVNGTVIIDSIYDSATAPFAACGQVQIMAGTPGSGGDTAGTSILNTTTAGTYSMSWTASGAGTSWYAQSAAALNPAEVVAGGVTYHQSFITIQ